MHFPSWNITFFFSLLQSLNTFLHYVWFLYLFDLQNILELTLYDRDVVIDDKITSIVFDVGNIKPGQTKKEVFKLNPKVCA